MKENKSWFRKSDAVIAACFIPIIILIIIFIQREIFPFGDNSYLRTDMYHQYAPFFSEFQYKLQNGKSLLYSWDVGLGVNFSAIYAYYLASPLNWFLIFVPKANVIEFMDYGIVLKTGLAGLCMAIYLNKHAKNSNFGTAFFAIFYALSGYMAAYNWNVMWLDCIAIFPIIVLGLEKLVEEKKGVLYCIMLAVAILSNYYISIMICIFMCIYMVMLLIFHAKSFGDVIGTLARFALYSLVAGAIAAVVYVPHLIALSATASAETSFPKTITSYFSIADVFARHMVNVDVEQGLDHWPNIYCGVAVMMLSILFAFNKKIELKKRIVYLVVIVLLLASFSLNALAYVWHGFHYPNSLPARQSFIYIFLMLYISFKALDEIEASPDWIIGIATAVVIVFIFLCQKFVTDDAFSWDTFYVSAIFVAVYGLLTYLYRAEKINVNAATFITLAVVAIESAVNMTSTSFVTINRSDYVSDNAAIRASVKFVHDSDEDIYRFDKTVNRAKDDGAWLNYESASLFSSTAHSALTAFYKDLGLEASTNAYSMVGATPLVRSLLDVRYTMSVGENYEPDKEHVATSENIYTYKNKYTLPLGYAVNSSIETGWDYQQNSPIDVQNALSVYVGAPSVLNRVEGFMQDGDYSFTVPEDGVYYAYSENMETDKIKISKGAWSKSFDNVKRGYLIELGMLYKNDIVDIHAQDGTDLAVHAYRFDYDALGALVDKLADEPLVIDHWSDTKISAHIDMNNSGILMTTIPYDKSWKIIVDGAERSARGLFEDAFLGIDLDAGYHDIEFSYMPEGLEMSKWISFGALIVLVILILWSLRSHFFKKAEEETVKPEEKAAEPEAEIVSEEAIDSEAVDGEQEAADANVVPEELNMEIVNAEADEISDVTQADRIEYFDPKENKEADNTLDDFIIEEIIEPEEIDTGDMIIAIDDVEMPFKKFENTLPGRSRKKKK